MHGVVNACVDPWVERYVIGQMQRRHDCRERRLTHPKKNIVALKKIKEEYLMRQQNPKKKY